MGFDQNYVTSTGSVVHVFDDWHREDGVSLHFINPCVSETDIPSTQTAQNESGRHLVIDLSEEAAELLLALLSERFSERRGNGN